MFIWNKTYVLSLGTAAAEGSVGDTPLPRAEIIQSHRGPGQDLKIVSLQALYFAFAI